MSVVLKSSRIENRISLEDLNFRGNKDLGEQPFSFTGLMNLKKLDMSECGFEKFPDRLEN